jgi:hypothetical protein
VTCLLLTNPPAATIVNVVSGPYVAFRSVVSIAIDRQGARPGYFNNTISPCCIAQKSCSKWSGTLNVAGIVHYLDI